MIENALDALTAQLRKTLELLEKRNGSFSEAEQLEFTTAETMMRSTLSQRGRHRVTSDQAIELTIVLHQIREARHAQGAEDPPFEEVRALAEQLLGSPRPVRN
jgi:hypothetical protein